MNDDLKTVVHDYYNTKVPVPPYWRTARDEAATLSPEEYEWLYQIATTKPVYSKKVELLQKTLQHYRNRKSCNSPLPLIFRQAVYLLAYELCNGDYYDTAQKKALDDVGLAHNSFSKWKMSPKNDFNAQSSLTSESIDVPTIVPLKYQGKKNMALIYLASELSKQVPYKKFVDIFGGSGAVTVGIAKKPDAQYFINDADPDQTNIYDLLRNQGKDFIKDISEIYNIIHKLSEASVNQGICLSLFPKVTVSELIDIGKSLVVSSHQKAYEKYSVEDDKYKKYLENHPDIPLSGDIYQVPSVPTVYNHDIRIHLRRIYNWGNRVNALVDDLSHPEILFSRGLFKYFDSVRTQPDCFSIRQRAVATMFQQSISLRPRADLSDCITQEKLKKICSNLSVWNRVVGEYKHYKIKVFNELDVEVVSREDINRKDTLLYLDSPYIATVGYKSIYGQKEFKALHDKLAGFAGYWIFSCRVGINYKSDPYKIPENDTKFMDKYDNLQYLINLYSDIAQYVAFIRDKDISDQEYFIISGIREVMFLNFSASIPDMNILRKLTGRKIDGANRKSVYRIISYKEFLPMAMQGIDPKNW